VKVRTPYGTKVSIKRRWTLWKPLVKKEYLDRSNETEAERLADEGYEQLGALGMVIGLVASIQPLFLMVGLMVVEKIAMVLLLPLSMVLKEVWFPWTIEVHEGKTMFYWEEVGFLRSRRLMKRIAGDYRKRNEPRRRPEVSR